MLAKLFLVALAGLSTVVATSFEAGLKERQSGCTAKKRLAGAKLIVNSYNKVGKLSATKRPLSQRLSSLQNRSGPHIPKRCKLMLSINR